MSWAMPMHRTTRKVRARARDLHIFESCVRGQTHPDTVREQKLKQAKRVKLPVDYMRLRAQLEH